MKNILAENLLRFGLKNADVDVVNKLQSLSEQEENKTGMASAGLVLSDINGITLAKRATPVKLTTDDGTIIVFNGTNNFENNLAAESNACVVYRHSNTKYIAIGMIGTYNENSNTVTNPAFRAILFRVIPATASNDSIGKAIPIVTIPANIPRFVIGKVVKALIPNIGKQGSAYLTNDTNGKALLSGIINMYKMNNQMTDFDITNTQQLLSLANSAGKIAATKSA